MLRENNRGQMLRSATILTGMVLMITIDTTNTDVDMCAYTIEGSRDSLVEAIGSFEPSLEGTKDLMQLECTPSIG